MTKDVVSIRLEDHEREALERVARDWGVSWGRVVARLVEKAEREGWRLELGRKEDEGEHERHL